MKVDSSFKKDINILKSNHYGDISYADNEIISFEKGMLGFENLGKFILREIKENPMFKLLHSLEDENIAFVVLNPFDIKKDYEIDLEDDVIRRLEIKKPEEVLLLNTVTLDKDPKKITSNLRAPIVMNVRLNKAEQVILRTENYKIKHYLVEDR